MMKGTAERASHGKQMVLTRPTAPVMTIPVFSESVCVRLSGCVGEPVGLSSLDPKFTF